MSALEDALAMVIRVHDNEQALADPVAVAWQAEMEFKQAVVDTLNMLLKPVLQMGLPSATAADHAATAAVADAAPSSSEPATIAPSNAGV